MAADETVSIGLLREIRDAVEKLGTRLEDSLGKRIDETNERLAQLDTRLTGRLDGMDGRLDNLERRVTLGFLETNTKLADLTGRVERVEIRVGGLEGEVGKLGARIDNLAGTVGKEVREQGERTSIIEEKLESLGISEASPEYGKKE